MKVAVILIIMFYFITYKDMVIKLKLNQSNTFKCLFENHVRSLGEPDSKLMLYSKVKRQYSDCHDLRSLVKFRMSIHGFPIERDRYSPRAAIAPHAPPPPPGPPRVVSFCSGNSSDSDSTCYL